MRISNSSLSELIASGRLAWSVLASLPNTSVVVFDRDLTLVAAAGGPLTASGFDPAEIVGRDVRDVLPAATYAQYAPHYAAALAGETTSIELVSSNERFVFATDFSPLRDEDGTVLGGLAVSRDVTAERRAQAELAEREELYRYLTEDASDVISRIAPDGTILYISPACRRLFGYEPDELVGRSSFELFEPHDLPDPDEAHATMTGSDGTLSGRFMMRRSDGGTVLVESVARPRRGPDGSVTDLHVVTRDISDRLAAEEAQRLFEVAFDEAPMGMAIVGLDGRWLRVNESLCRITGYGEEELVGRGFRDLTDPEDLDRSQAAVQRLLAGEVERCSMEKRYRTKQGEQIWVTVFIALVRATDGTPLYFVSQTKDISDRKRLEETLHHLADHDPLTGLWNRRRFDEELSRQVARSQRYGERAALLVIDLNDFKPVNDTAGHKAGDTLLRAIGDTLTARVREGDAVARIGGDECAVLLANVSRAEADRIAGQLADAIAATDVATAGRHMRVTASIGIGMIEQSTAGADEVFVAADRAMYAVKPSAARDAAPR